MVRSWVWVVSAVLLGCGDDADHAPDAPVAIDAALDASVDAPPALPLIGEAVGCGRVGTAGGLGAGNDLQRHDLDTTVFPDALCNDGTTAIFYYRPYNGAANRNRWVIQLQGGGSCGSGDECAKRWCMVDTAFSMHGMTSSVAPDTSINGKGILARRADNPIGGFNQVFVKYCSSDTWTGTARDVVTMVTDPAAGGPKAYRIHMLGARIFDAVVDTLRQQGVAGLSYTLGGSSTALPDLDDATQIVLAGGSAGGAGVIRNLDDFAARFPSADVRGLADSAFPLALQQLDYSTSLPCLQAGVCSWEQFLDYSATQGADAFWKSRREASCVAWHEAHLPGEEKRCFDGVYLLENHVTTPIFVRQGQTDDTISKGQIEAMYSAPNGGGILDITKWAAGVRLQTNALPNITTTANEASAITVAPGVFSPSCSAHEVLSEDDQIFGVTIDVGGTSYRMFQVIGAWFTGGSPATAVTPLGGTDVCPP